MILFFYGEETYQSSQKVKQLKKNFFEKNPNGDGLVEFDCDEDCNIANIKQSFGEQSLFATKKLIIIQNFFANTKAPEQKDIIERLENNIDDIIVFFENGKVKKNAVLFKWLNNNADTIKESNLLDDYTLEEWIGNQFKKNDTKIENDAKKELILFVGNDLWKLSQEIEKLICYVNKGTVKICYVHEIVKGKIDADMFEMIEAVASGNRGVALKLLNKQIAAGDDKFHIFSMYAYQVRTLVNVGSAMEDGLRDKSMIASSVKLHPFVVQKSIGMVDRLSYAKIKQMHKMLVKYDFDIKLGNCDIDSALDLFIVNS
ncbi:MAG: DNA polymerase III subunit delta [Candidatus Moraniibacteriota bacterium]|jgi:DNA polymerase III subunit delta